jgi:Tfp pilus assembly protein PilO
VSGVGRARRMASRLVYWTLLFAVLAGSSAVTYGAFIKRPMERMQKADSREARLLADLEKRLAAEAKAPAWRDRAEQAGAADADLARRLPARIDTEAVSRLLSARARDRGLRITIAMAPEERMFEFYASARAQLQIAGSFERVFAFVDEVLGAEQAALPVTVRFERSPGGQMRASLTLDLLRFVDQAEARS